MTASVLSLKKIMYSLLFPLFSVTLQCTIHTRHTYLIFSSESSPFWRFQYTNTLKLDVAGSSTKRGDVGGGGSGGRTSFSLIGRSVV